MKFKQNSSSGEQYCICWGGCLLAVWIAFGFDCGKAAEREAADHLPGKRNYLPGSSAGYKSGLLWRMGSLPPANGPRAAWLRGRGILCANRKAHLSKKTLVVQIAENVRKRCAVEKGSEGLRQHTAL